MNWEKSKGNAGTLLGPITLSIVYLLYYPHEGTYHSQTVLNNVIQSDNSSFLSYEENVFKTRVM